MFRSRHSLVAGAVLAVGAGLLPAQRSRSDDVDPAKAFFAKGSVVRIEITLDPADRQLLRDRPREYVPATLRVDDGKQPWTGVGIKLKGAAGSFRKIDERPGFTVNLGKFGGEQWLHGLRRFHLNNGVQDSSRLCEWLGHEVFVAAGYPAPRVAHAHVVLDGQPLGLYVLREGYDKQFLQRVFGHRDGNLYDGGFCRDVDSDLEKDAGDGVDDHSDLHRLLDASRDFDPEVAARFERAVDVAAMIDFLALESMLGHWDGYGQNRNNFRLWIDGAEGTALFLPHGMDQLLGKPEASILKKPTAIAARALMSHPEWRQRYRERLKDLLPLFSPRQLESKIDKAQKRIERALRKVDPEAVKAQKAAAARLVDRVRARYRSLREQVRAPEPEPLAFKGGRAVALREWRAAAKTDHLELREKDYRGVKTLRIARTGGGADTVHGVYRTTELLARGRYRLTAAVRCEGVEPGAEAEAAGAFLAVGEARSAALTGEQNWQALTCEFEVTLPQDDVELGLVLQARAGQVWFRLGSLELERLE